MTVPPTPSTAADAETRDTLQAALDIFKGPCSTAAVPAGGRQQLRDLAEKQKQAAARAVLLVSGGSGSSGGRAAVPDAELRGVVSSLEQSTIALCSYCHRFTAGAGPSLVASLKALCSAVVTPSQELAAKLASGSPSELRRCVGEVWSACDELAGGPLDNKACLFRQLADVMSGVKAAAKELDELVEESRRELAGSAGPRADHALKDGEEAEGQQGSSRSGSEPAAASVPAPSGAATRGSGDGEPGSSAAGPDGVRGGSGGGSSSGAEAGEGEEHSGEGDGDSEESNGEDDEDSDDFREMGTLSGTELRTAEAAGALLAAAQAAMRAISRPLLEGPAVHAGQSLDEWESLAWHATKLRSTCEALVACLYPPHEDLAELSGNGDAVANTLELMLEEFPGGEDEGAGEDAAEGEGQEAAQGGHSASEAVRRALQAARGQVEAAAGRLTHALARAAGPAL